MFNEKIILTGGGTGGSVTPLLALADKFDKNNLLWIGTENGLEKNMIESEGIRFISIKSGKLRRYFDWKNFSDLFLIIFGFFQSFTILLKIKPGLVMTAGSFVSVPVVWAAWILRIPVLIHQQDVRPGLANKLMAPFARIITVTFEKSLGDYGKKAVWTGNPARRSLEIPRNKKQETSHFDLNDDIPTILILGGGTGSMAINKLVEESLDELTKFCQIIHVAGRGKMPSVKNENYKAFEFLGTEQMAEAYAVSDIVISRAGMGTLTELSHLGKPAIIIPMPDSHQEDNASIFKEKEAAVILGQKDLKSDVFLQEVGNLLNNDGMKEKLSQNIKKVIKSGADETILMLIKNLNKVH